MQSQNSIHVGDWLVEPLLNRITNGAGTLRLEPRLMDVLVCLASSPGEVVTRDSLMETVWHDSYVGDDQLNRVISELRRALGDEPQDPHFIETIPKRGYRLIAPVDGQVGAGITASTSAVTEPRGSANGYVRYFAGTTVLAVVLVAIVFGRRAWNQPGNSFLTEQLETVPLTAFPGQERYPAISSSGEQVAFVWNGRDGNQFDLYLKPIGDEQLEQITDTPWDEASPTWSPNDQQIAFLRLENDACWIYITTTIGLEEARIAECHPSAHALQWSPDGNTLIFSERASSQDPFKLVGLSLETHERELLTEPPVGYHGDTFPAFSPDAKWIAFARNIHDWTGHLIRIPAAGGVTEQITLSLREIIGIDWSPESDRIVFATNVGGGHRIWSIPSYGGDTQEISAAGWRLKRPTLSRTKSILAYENWIYDTNIWRTDLAPETGARPERQPIIASTLWDTHPTISPDQTHIAFVSSRSGSYEIWLAEADGAQPTKLTDFGGPFVGPPSFSPDGKHIVFDARPRGTADLFVVQIEEKHARRLTHGLDNEILPHWSNDGLSIYFASDRDTLWQVWRISVNNGNPERITHAGGFEAIESTDGSELYFTKPGRSGIWSMGLQGGQKDRLLVKTMADPWSNWSVVGSRIYVLDHTPEHRFPLIRFDLDSSASTELLELPAAAENHGFDISSDETWVTYTREDRAESDLMYARAR